MLEYTDCSAAELVPWSRVLDKLTVSQLVEKFHAFYGTRRFYRIRYDIYLLQLGCHPVAVVLTLVHKRQEQ